MSVVHIHKPFLLVLLMILVGIAQVSEAVELQVNQLYHGGTQVESSEIDLGLTIPEGWQGALPAGSSLFVMESAALQATLLIYAETMSAEQLQQTMQQAIPLDASIVLMPKSTVKHEGGLLVGDYQTTANPALQSRIFGRTGDNGLSVAVIALTTGSGTEQVWSIATQVAQNLRFLSPQRPAQSVASGQSDWQEYMRGRYIARYYSGSGYHEKQELWLCSNGDFYSAGDAGGYGGGASGAFSNQGQGRWRAQGSLPGQGRLILQYGEGSQFEGSTGDSEWTETGAGGQRIEFSLTLQSDKLHLNGTQWLRGNNDYCR